MAVVRDGLRAVELSRLRRVQRRLYAADLARVVPSAALAVAAHVQRRIRPVAGLEPVAVDGSSHRLAPARYASWLARAST